MNRAEFELLYELEKSLNQGFTEVPNFNSADEFFEWIHSQKNDNDPLDSEEHF